MAHRERGTQTKTVASLRPRAFKCGGMGDQVGRNAHSRSRRSRTTTPRGPPTSCSASSWRRNPTSCGSRISLTSRRGPASSTSRSSSTCSPDASWVGVCRALCAATWPSMRSSRRFTSARTTMTSCIIAITGSSTSRSATAIGSHRQASTPPPCVREVVASPDLLIGEWHRS